MDELAINPSAKYHRKSNEVLGFCANHSTCLDSLKFSHWSDFLEIKKAFSNKIIHLAKEALFFTIGKTKAFFIIQLFISFNYNTLKGKISKDDSVPKPIVILPICSHKNSFQQLAIIKTIVKKFSIICGDAILVNVATDGDPCRKKLLPLTFW